MIGPGPGGPRDGGAGPSPGDSGPRADPPAGGWTRRFVAAPPRLAEAVELYERLGYEVRVEPVPEEEWARECAGCALAPALFRVIYTRRRT